MVGWHHRLNGHEFEQAPGDGKGQRSVACYSPWGHKESDMTQQLEKNNQSYPQKYSKRKVGCIPFVGSQGYGFSTVMYGCESWIMKKAER